MLTLEQTQKKAMEELKSKEEQKELEIAQAEHEDELQEQQLREYLDKLDYGGKHDVPLPAQAPPTPKPSKVPQLEKELMDIKQQQTDLCISQEKEKLDKKQQQEKDLQQMKQ